MRVLDDLRAMVRTLVGLRRFLRETISLADAEQSLREMQAGRSESFLRLVKKGIYGGKADNPYLRMLNHARIGYDEIAAWVADMGLEGALARLHDAGVYLSFEEFKGRAEVVRGDLRFKVAAMDFANPHMESAYRSETSGSTGVGTRVSHDLDLLHVQAYSQLIAHYANDVLDAPIAVWRGVLPDGAGLNNMLRTAHFGCTPKKWFAHNIKQTLRPEQFKYLVATVVHVITARLFGSPMPFPESVPNEDAIKVARWARRMIDQHGKALILTTASRGLRAGLAAEEAGIDLTGAVFVLAGESSTPAKVEGVQRTGARVLTSYAMAETGRIGFGCSDAEDVTDVHINTTTIAMIQCMVDVPTFAEPVPAITLTSLQPAAPFILINLVTDDYGVLEHRECGCALGKMGFDLHLSQIYSYTKFSGEGVTLAGSEMIHLLEEVLPAKFGGTPFDYQLEETEDGRGFTQMNLVVSPRVVIADEAALISEMVQHLKQTNLMSELAGEAWRDANALHVKREEPYWTPRGKYLPIRKLRRK